MYAKILGNEIIKFPYTFFDLQNENPFTAFDDRFSIADWYAQTEDCLTTNAEVKKVTILEEPLYNSETHVLQLKNNPEFLNKNLILGWDVLEISVQNNSEIDPNQ